MATLSQELVDWAWSLRVADIPAPVRRTAARHLTDGVGCAIAAVRTAAVPYATVLADGQGSSTVLGHGRSSGAADAAFANGVLLHALDFDDTHAGGLVHATAAVLPALFAIGEETGVDGPQAMTAAIAGYETVTRIGQGVRHGFHARGFHATSVCGVFAATLVTALLRGLDRETAVSALGIAGSFASGSLEFLHTGSSTKQIHPGWAARAGIEAATLAAAGASGPSTILEGANGLYRMFTGHEVDPTVVVGGLGQEWETTRITIKPYPVCQLSHAAIDALLAVLDEVGSSDRVAGIEVAIPDESIPVVAEPRAAKLAPRSPYEAKFSLPWTLAALILDGRVTIDTFHPDRLDRPEVRRLAERIQVRGYPSPVAAADSPGRVTITFDDGRAITGAVPTSTGGPDTPLSDTELVAKFSANCGAAISDPEGLAHRLLGLEGETGLTALLRDTAIG